MHARLLPRPSWNWTVLLHSDTHSKPITSIAAALLPFVTYLLTVPRTLHVCVEAPRKRSQQPQDSMSLAGTEVGVFVWVVNQVRRSWSGLSPNPFQLDPLICTLFSFHKLYGFEWNGKMTREWWVRIWKKTLVAYFETVVKLASGNIQRSNENSG
jgi:hypothetical protein